MVDMYEALTKWPVLRTEIETTNRAIMPMMSQASCPCGVASLVRCHGDLASRALPVLPWIRHFAWEQLDHIWLGSTLIDNRIAVSVVGRYRLII